MSFVHPWALLLVLCPIVWLILSVHTAPSRTRLVLKVLAFVAIVLAYSEPTLQMPEAKTGLVVLCDVSKSISSQQLQRASAVLSALEKTKKQNWISVVPFADEPGSAQLDLHDAGLHSADFAHGDHTNVEAALSSSIAAIPPGYVPRVVLMSDGNENEGSAARAAAELQDLHVPVDTIPLTVNSENGLRLLHVEVPERAYANEQTPIDLTVFCADDTSADIAIAANGKPLGTSRVELKRGVNRVRVHARVNSSGGVLLSGRLTDSKREQLTFESAIELRRAKVLYISGDAPSMDENLLSVFHEAAYEVVEGAPFSVHDVPSYQLIVLNNLDLNEFSRAVKRQLADYVEGGGGLLLIGGEKQVYKEAAYGDELDRILPAKLAPPKKQEGLCVALIIDKSSSMEGKKIELARLSAIGAVDHLKPTDTIGVLMFDNSYQWAVPMRSADNKASIDRLISGITPDGGTQIAPALAEAYNHVLASSAAYKHVVLLTDGISEEGDSIDLAREAARHEITISTVGLGSDVNRSYLERIAASSGGKAYFLNDPQGLEQILLKDVMDYGGSTTVEKSLTPIVQSDAEILHDVDIPAAPALKGYTRFKAKPTAQTILSIDRVKRDPLYTRWQYGLGRVGVFTSDAKSRWANAWISWPGFDKFWTNVSHDLLSRTGGGEGRADFDSTDGNLLVSYQVRQKTELAGGAPTMFVLGPSGFEAALSLREIGPNLYRGSIHIGQRTGLFRVRPLQESDAFPEVSLYRPNEEALVHGANEPLLREISQLSGGRYNPDLSTVFDVGDRATVKVWQLWPGLLAFALALNIAELILRKWRGVAGWIRERVAFLAA